MCGALTISFFQNFLYLERFVIMSETQYVPVFIAALAVLLVGWWNPKQLRSKQAANPSTVAGQCHEHTDYRWLALIALVAGAGGVMLMPSMKPYLKM